MGRPKSQINGKYQWISRDLDTWLKEQSSNAEKNGFRGTTALASHRLFHDFIVPNKVNIEFNPPRVKYKKLKRFR